MFWLEHLFALCILGHMLWAAILLQGEWRRLHVRNDAGTLHAYEEIPLPATAEASPPFVR